jgi:hypothetical protein
MMPPGHQSRAYSGTICLSTPAGFVMTLVADTSALLKHNAISSQRRLARLQIRKTPAFFRDALVRWFARCFGLPDSRQT